jgi:alkanesulfonate monooxygenase SsuD/methylene tetrahydromethanopterin reductase-like flavin-dependent oxidoreductase (luciferase family)
MGGADLLTLPALRLLVTATPLISGVAVTRRRFAALGVPATPPRAGPGRPAPGRLVVGTPPRVRDRLVALAGEFGVDELVVVTVCHDPAARLRSYELVAQALA